jgi:hypothetical protein
VEYAILIYRDESETDVDWAQREADWAEYFSQLGAAGAMRGGPRVDDSTKATTVKVRDGRREVTDGPFIPGVHQLSGVFVVDCATRGEAIDWAVKCPGASHGTIEVRDVVPS